jgi:hypothetical protein
MDDKKSIELFNDLTPPEKSLSKISKRLDRHYQNFSLESLKEKILKKIDIKNSSLCQDNKKKLDLIKNL